MCRGGGCCIGPVMSPHINVIFQAVKNIRSLQPEKTINMLSRCRSIPQIPYRVSFKKLSQCAFTMCPELSLVGLEIPGSYWLGTPGRRPLTLAYNVLPPPPETQLAAEDSYSAFSTGRWLVRRGRFCCVTRVRAAYFLKNPAKCHRGKNTVHWEILHFPCMQSNLFLTFFAVLKKKRDYIKYNRLGSMFPCASLSILIDC